MGQGITTGMPMIFADELGADLSAMKIVCSDYNPQIEYSLQGITGGSSSIQSTWIPLRQSGSGRTGNADPGCSGKLESG